MTPNSDDFTTIQPRKVKLSHQSNPSSPEARNQQASYWWLLLPGIALLAGIWVFFVLPEHIDSPKVTLPRSPDTSGPVHSTAPESALSASETVAPLKQMELERARKKAQETLARYVKLQIQLEDAMQVAKWGGERYATYRALASEGDALFLERDYDAAIARYKEGADGLEQLVAEGEALYQQSVSAGNEALINLDAETASRFFQQAAMIHPDTAEVTKGIERVAKLPQVTDLFEQARSLTESGQFSKARELYRQILKLDPDTQGIHAAIASLDAQILEFNFKRYLSEGYVALNSGNFDIATTSFNRALQLKPDNRIVLDGLRQVEQNLIIARIGRLQKEAKNFESNENWQQALLTYTQALKLDPSLKFAKQGSARARQRLKLSEQLNKAIAHPELLSSDETYQRTQTLYKRALSIENPGPELSGKLKRLSHILEIAANPVSVTLLSDNQTEITILKLGPIGRFSSKGLQLRPGRYVMTGSRDGCRDVRKEVDVAPDMPPVTIQCEETI